MCNVLFSDGAGAAYPICTLSGIFHDVQCVNHIVRCVKFDMKVVLINKQCFGGSNTEDNLITSNIANDSSLKRDTLRVF